MSVLKTTDLSIGYFEKNQKKIIQNKIDLTCNKGQLISVLGSNGIGKSTLLRTLCGIQRPLHGNIVLNNQNLSSYSSEDLAKVLSVVFTEKITDAHLTVQETVMLGRTPYLSWHSKASFEDVQLVEESLQLCDIFDLRYRMIQSLSDGQLQKVLIARAIAQDTPLIVLDEPSTHLDLYHKFELFKLLKFLTVKKQKCILFSTHDMDLAIQMSDEIVALLSKQVIQGTVEELLHHGIFYKFFNDETIVFDPVERRFKLNII